MMKKERLEMERGLAKLGAAAGNEKGDGKALEMVVARERAQAREMKMGQKGSNYFFKCKRSEKT